MSMSLLVEKTIVTYNFSNVTFVRTNLLNSIRGRKNEANFAQIGGILFNMPDFILKFQISAKNFSSGKNRTILKSFGLKEFEYILTNLSKVKCNL
jgi:hypothetical protein